MVDVCVYEDSLYDLERRYWKVAKRAYVFVAMFNQVIGNEPQLLQNNWGMVKFGEEVFDWVPKADLYFTDGLHGRCFSLLDKLPNDKAYLVTRDPILRKEGIRRKFLFAMDNLIMNIVEEEIRRSQRARFIIP